MFNQSLFTYLVRAMVLLTAIPIHECAHAWASNKLGDPTAKNLGASPSIPCRTSISSARCSCSLPGSAGPSPSR